jgi:hypothetical protein
MSKPKRAVVGKTTWRSYSAELGVWAITVIAMGVSYFAQVASVSTLGYTLWEARGVGAITDLGELVAVFLARESATRNTPSWGAWALAAFCAGTSILFNVFHHVGNPLAFYAHTFPPLLALGCWYWMLHGRHAKWNPAQAIADHLPNREQAQPTQPPTTRDQDLPKDPPKRLPKGNESGQVGDGQTDKGNTARPTQPGAAQLAAEALGQPWTSGKSDAAIAKHLGIGTSTVQRVRSSLQAEGEAA